MDILQWSIGVAAFAAGAICAWLLLGTRKGGTRRRSPERWDISARPVFTANERLLHRALLAALPQYLVLAKLPLVRFCQPLTPSQSAYWYDLLQPLQVSFAICSPNGRVLAAVDLDAPSSSRQLRMKAAALEACRIRYVTCSAQALPSTQEIQQWQLVPSGASGLHEPARVPAVEAAGAQLARTVRARRAERAERWQDSSFASDSFFAPDSRLDELLSAPTPLDDTGGPSSGSARLA